MKKEKYEILLVDDNKLNQSLVKFSFKQQKHILSLASSGQEAIDMFEEGKFDLILMDIMMPNLDGYETCIEIRKLEHKIKIPIIAFTADTTGIDKCKEVGMNAFLLKPFDFDKLIQIIDKLEI